ncbi:MAG: tetratricopeptide repeat protein [Desulfosudaceae bacterium]
MAKRLVPVLISLLLLLGAMVLPGTAREAGQSFFDAGVFAYESGDFDTAEEQFKKALAQDPGNPLYSYYLSKSYIKINDFSQAAVHLDTARASDFFIPGLAFDWGFVNYKLANYQIAADIFAGLAGKEPSNALARYYAGMSRLRLEQYDQAARDLEAAAGMNTNIRYNSTYYAGVCYLKAGRTDLARKRFDTVAEEAAGKELVSAARIQLGHIRQKEREGRKYSLMASIGCEYDDNALLEPIDQDDLYAEEDDFITTASFSGGYDFIKTATMVLGAGYSHYQMWYSDNTEYDLTGSIFDVHARYRRGAFTAGLTYKPAYYWLDSSSYLMRHTITPVVAWQGRNWQTELSYSYLRDNNMYNNEEDGHRNRGMLRFLYLLPDEKGKFRAGAGYEVNSAQHDDYDWDRINTELGLYLNVWWGITCGLTGQCRFKEYDHKDSIYDVKRDDTKYIGNVFGEKYFYKDILSATLLYEYTENDSNISNYEFRSNAVKLFLTAKL